MTEGSEVLVFKQIMLQKSQLFGWDGDARKQADIFWEKLVYILIEININSNSYIYMTIRILMQGKKQFLSLQ